MILSFNREIERPFTIADLAGFLGRLAVADPQSAIHLILDNGSPVVKIIQSPFNIADCVVITRTSGAAVIPYARSHLVYSFIQQMTNTPILGNKAIPP